jgi:hypothetical protein
MSNYFGANFAADEKAKATKKARRILGMPVAIFAGLATLAVAGVAYAAIAFTMSGSVSAEADNGTNPTISNEHFSGKFFPGATRDLVFNVANPNDFPVKVTQVSLASGPSNVSAGCDLSKLSGPGGSTLSSFSIAAADQISVPAHDTKTITISDAVHLDASATKGCGFTLGLSVTGSGAGN